MKNKLSQNVTYWLGVAAIGLVVGLSLQFVRAWTEPSVAPPGGNIGAPINTSINPQTKAGGLGVTQNLIVGGNVGIGTTAPGYKLQVNGKIQAIGGDICTDQGGGKCLSAAGGGTLSCTTVTCDSDYSCVATCPADRVVTGCNNYGFYSVNSVGVSYFVGNGCTGGSFDGDTRVVVQARCCKI